jgi:hypothetical protein
MNQIAAEIVDTWGEQHSVDLDDEELMTAAIEIVDKLKVQLRRGDVLDAQLSSCTAGTRQ